MLKNAFFYTISNKCMVKKELLILLLFILKFIVRKVLFWRQIFEVNFYNNCTLPESKNQIFYGWLICWLIECFKHNSEVNNRKRPKFGILNRHSFGMLPEVFCSD